MRLILRTVAVIGMGIPLVPLFNAFAQAQRRSSTNGIVRQIAHKDKSGRNVSAYGRNHAFT